MSFLGNIISLNISINTFTYKKPIKMTSFSLLYKMFSNKADNVTHFSKFIEIKKKNAKSCKQILISNKFLIAAT